MQDNFAAQTLKAWCRMHAPVYTYENRATTSRVAAKIVVGIGMGADNRLDRKAEVARSLGALDLQGFQMVEQGRSCTRHLGAGLTTLSPIARRRWARSPHAIGRL